MKYMKILIGLVLALAWSGVAWADAIPPVVSPTTNANWTVVVFNDSGAEQVSGAVVVWDNDDASTDAEFDESFNR